MTLLAYLAEPFSLSGSYYKSNSGSLAFLQDAFSKEEIFVASTTINSENIKPSSSIHENYFEEVQGYDSIKDFVVKSIKNPTFFFKYIQDCNDLLDKHKNSRLWIRNPSIGCLIFSLCALKKDRTIYNHMCANAIYGWKNNKYSNVEKLLGFAFSLVMRYMIFKVIKNKLTVNLCTGDELLSICKKYNPNSYQFVDSLIELDGVDFNTDSLNKAIFKFLFIGRVQEDKGVVDLIESFICLLKENGNLELDIVGDGVLLNGLREKYKCCKKIIFHGQIPHDKLNFYIKKSSVIVVPSKNRYEGFPRVIMESWSMKKPVIVSDVGGVKAFVMNYYNGILYPYLSMDGLISSMRNVLDPVLYEKLVIGASDMSRVSNKRYWINELRKIIV